MSTIVRIADACLGEVIISNQHSSISYKCKLTDQINDAMMSTGKPVVYAKAKFDKRSKTFEIISFVKDPKWG